MKLFVQQNLAIAWLVSLFTFLPQFHSSMAQQGSSCDLWPAETRWVALTNNISACYSGLVLRCVAADLDPSRVPKPTYIHPMQDYTNFANTIDWMCQYFVCQTNAGESGTFDKYFSTPRSEGQSDYPEELPMWTTSNLHSFLSITNWSTNVLNGWMFADRNIQKLLGSALCQLRWTSKSSVWKSGASSTPVGNVGSVGVSFIPSWSWCNDLIYEGTSYPEDCKSADEAIQLALSDANQNGPMVPTATGGGGSRVTSIFYNPDYSYYSANLVVYKNTLRVFNINPEFTGITINFYATPCHDGMIFDPQGTTLQDGVTTRLFSQSNLSNITSWEYPELIFNLSLDSLSWAAPVEHDTISKGFTTSEYETFCTFQWTPDPQCNSFDWEKPEHLSYVETALRYVPENLISATIVDNVAPSAFAYISFVFGGAYLDACRAKIEVSDLSTSIFHAVDFYAKSTRIGSSTNQWNQYDAGGENLAENRFSWFDTVSGVSSNLQSRFLGKITPPTWPDTNVVNCFTFYRGYRVVNQKCVVKWDFPVISECADEKFGQESDIDRDDLVDIACDVSTIENSCGMFVLTAEDEKPFVIIPLASPPVWYPGLHVHAYLSQGATTNLPYTYLAPDSYDNDGYYSAFSANTRIEEVGCITNNGTYCKRVSLVRPRGNVVEFDFKWMGNNFAENGYPVGVNSNRTYVLVDLTPSENMDESFKLCFSSGINHVFQGNLVGVSRYDGRTFACSPGWGSGDGLFYFTYGNQAQSDGPVSVSSAEYASADITWDKGSILKVIYQNRRGSRDSNAVTFGYDASKRIININKQLFPTANSCLSSNGKEISYASGFRISRATSGTAGTARTVVVTRISPVSGSLAEEVSFDSFDRKTNIKIGTGGLPAETVYVYDEQTGRYPSGLAKQSRISRIINPDGSIDILAYTNEGWIRSKTRNVGNGYTRSIEYDYDNFGVGDAAISSNIVERPRCIIMKYGAETISKTLYSFSGNLQQHMQVCANASAGWDAVGNLKSSLYLSTWKWLPIETIDPFEHINYNYSYDEQNAVLTTSWNSFGQTITNRINARGLFELSQISENNLIISRAFSTVDSFGRIIKTEYLDGTWTENSNYGLFGPLTICGIDGSLSNYQYDDLGRIRSINEPSLGRTTEYIHDMFGNIKEKTTIAGNQRLLVETIYDALGRITARKNEIGTATYVYSQTGEGARRTTSLPSGATIVEDRYFDGNRKEISGTGAVAHKKYEYGVDQGMYFSREINGDNASEWIKVSYNMLGKPCQIARPNEMGEPVTTTIEYDSCGRPVKSTDPDLLTTLQSYNNKNEIENYGLHVDGNAGSLTPSSNDKFNTSRRTVNASGIKNETLGYPVANDPTSAQISSVQTSLDGTTSTFASAGRGSTSVRGNYQAGGSYSVTTSESDGTKIVSEYVKWRLDTVTRKDKNNAVIETEQYEYDGLGDLIRVVNNVRGTMQYVRNSKTRLVEKVIPFDSSKGEIDYAYYPGTDLVKYLRRSDGLFTRYDYLQNGLLKRVYDGPSHDIQLEYDGQGRQTRMTTWRDGKAVTTEWQYNSNSGNLVNKRLFGMAGPEASYHYRNNGQLESVTDAENVRTDFSYNNAGELISAVVNDGSSTIDSTFDRFGRKQSITALNGISETYTYGLDGSVLTDSITGNDVVSNVLLSYAYAFEHPGRIGLNYAVAGSPECQMAVTYDSAVRVSSITNGPLSVTYGYTAGGDKVSSVLCALGGTNIMTRAMNWDLKNMRITNISYQANGSNIASYAYAYTPNDDRIVRLNLLDGSFWIYEYDVKNQLKNGVKYNQDGTPVYGRQFGYESDSIGNLIKAGQYMNSDTPANSFTANDLNLHVARIWSNKIEISGSAVTNASVTVNDIPAFRQGARFSAIVPVNTVSNAVLTNITAYAVYFDGTNNLVASVSGKIYLPKTGETPFFKQTGEISADSRYTNTWNRLGQLTSVVSVKANPSFKLEFSYYPDGRRASKKIYQWSGSNWTLLGTHQFYYDQWNLVFEICNQQSLITTKSYLWGLDLAGQRAGKLGQEAGGIGGLLAITQTSNGVSKVYFPICDHNGNIQHLLDASSKQIVATYEYSPFGVLIGESGVAKNVCPFRFQSKYYDKETELYYFGYRYYDPNSCKWLSRDPLGEQGGVNLTAFCENDPVNKVDARGEEAYLVYRQFHDEGLKKEFPNKGHFYIAFDSRNISDLQKWRKMVEKYGRAIPSGSEALPRDVAEDIPNPDAETFSFHPAREGLSIGKDDYTIAGTFVTEGSYIGYNDSWDQNAFKSARDNIKSNPDILKAIVFPLHMTEQEQFKLYEQVIKSRNINNTSPSSVDIGCYRLGDRNCGTWAKWIIGQSGFANRYPKEALKYNTLLGMGGVALGGVADYSLLPKTGTVLAGVGGYTYQTGKGLAGMAVYGAERLSYIGEKVWENTEFFSSESGAVIQWKY